MKPLQKAICSQSGVTLTELMVAMTISLILLGGLYQVFFTSSNSYRKQQALSRLQENGRFAVELMAQEIRLAGTPRFYLDGTSFSGTPITGSPSTGTGAGTFSDSVTVSWDEDTSDPYDPGTIDVTTVRFRVDHDNRTLLRSKDGTETPLVEGVEEMQLEYGVDTDDDGSVDQYDPATTVTAAANWPNVIAVRIGILLRTPDQIPKLTPDTSSYSILGQNFVAPGDRRMRRLFTSTVTLRNRVQ